MKVIVEYEEILQAVVDQLVQKGKIKGNRQYQAKLIAENRIGGLHFWAELSEPNKT